MATNFDKGLYQAPQGLDELAQDAEPIEIEIIDPEEVHIGIDGLQIDIEKDEMRRTAKSLTPTLPSS